MWSSIDETVGGKRLQRGRSLCCEAKPRPLPLFPAFGSVETCISLGIFWFVSIEDHITNPDEPKYEPTLPDRASIEDHIGSYFYRWSPIDETVGGKR
jgi:hypothetical protein